MRASVHEQRLATAEAEAATARALLEKERLQEQLTALDGEPRSQSDRVSLAREAY